MNIKDISVNKLNPLTAYQPLSEKKAPSLERSKEYAKSFQELLDTQVRDWRQPAPIDMSTLHHAFEKWRVPSHYIEDQFWRYLLVNVKKQRLNNQACKYKLKYMVLKVPASVMYCEQWLEIYSMFLYMGLFQVGNYFREKALDSALLEAEEALLQKKAQPGRNIKNVLYRAIGACINLSNMRKAEDLIHRFGTISKQQKTIQTYKQLTNLLNGNTFGLKAVNDVLDKPSIKYFSYVNKQSIAIVAPSNLSSQSGKEIDSTDVVVRFNCREVIPEAENESRGNRVDVSYYAEAGVNLLTESNQSTLPDGITFAIFKNVSNADNIATSATKRQLMDYSKFLFHGSLHAVPNAVLDLLEYQPRSIKVFNADLMLTKDRFKGYRPDSFITQFSKNSVIHDPALQYLILNQLWKKDIISGDVRFTEVMSLGLDEYMTQLQDTYKRV